MAISASVGNGGKNLTADVRRVQEALNIARRREGLPAIKVDGLVGPETIGAISEFQRKHTKVVDGRIDPGGPALGALETIVASDVEPAVRVALVQILEDAERALLSRQLRVPQNVYADMVQIKSSILMLKGGGIVPNVQYAMYYPSQQGSPFRLAVAAVAAVPVAAAAAEAAMLLLLAMIAMLIVIQMAPTMGRAFEDLIRAIQVAMAKLVDEVQEAIQGVEDLIKRNSKAGMMCSAALIVFRQISNQLLDLLKAPRAKDELGRRRFGKNLGDLFEKWQQALADLLACLTSHGAV